MCFTCYIIIVLLLRRIIIIVIIVIIFIIIDIIVIRPNIMPGQFALSPRRFANFIRWLLDRCGVVFEALFAEASALQLAVQQGHLEAGGGGWRWLHLAHLARFKWISQK